MECSRVLSRRKTRREIQLFAHLLYHEVYEFFTYPLNLFVTEGSVLCSQDSSFVGKEPSGALMAG